MAEEDEGSNHTEIDLADIDPEQDVNIRVIGTIVTVNENSFVLDDSTAAKEAFPQSEVPEDVVEEGNTVRVFGRVLPTPDDFEIEAEVVQDFSDVDVEKFEKVKKVVSSHE